MRKRIPIAEGVTPFSELEQPSVYSGDYDSPNTAAQTRDAKDSGYMQPPSISFHGAARTVTGSKHIIHLAGDRKILLDCGLFQGMGRKTDTLNREWGFEPKEITHVVLSHAHIDHVGLLPKLFRDGYRGPVYCTPATADLAKLLLIDSARIQKQDAKSRGRRRAVEPLYLSEDVEAAVEAMVTVEYGMPYSLADDIELVFTEAGHILGSACVNLSLRDEEGKELRIAFSGDIGRYHDPLLRAPDAFPQADIILMETTYGDKLHGVPTPVAEELLGHIQRTCVEKGGKLIVPAFAVGRTQELVYVLNRLSLEKRLPDVPVYIDSPLANNATETIKDHAELLNDSAQRMMKIDDDVFDFPGLQYIENIDESKAIDKTDEASVIISASGMAEGGRIRAHIAAALEDERNTILIVGHSEPSTLGGQLRAGADEVAIFGDEYEVLADVAELGSMSAHGDYEDLLHWLDCQDAEKVQAVYLVHGEYQTQQAFRERLIRKGFRNVEIPSQHSFAALPRG